MFSHSWSNQFLKQNTIFDIPTLNFRAVSPGGKSQDDKTTSEAEKSHQNGGKNGGNGSDKSMDLDDRSPSRHKSKKHKKFKQRSR